MTNNDFQLEELENAAVNKSNNAKRIAVGAGLVTAGAGAAVAATVLANNNAEGETEETPEVQLNDSDLDGVAQTGANEVENNTAEPVQPQAQPQPQVINNHYYVVEEPKPEPEADVVYDKTTHIMDENGNIVASAESGTINGKAFVVLDTDNDGGGDVVAIDLNGNGRFEDNEITHLTGKGQIAMGHDTIHHEDIAINADVEPVEPVNPHEPDDYYVYNDDDEDIQNDFVDDRAGEDYSGDYADNNENYNNDGDVDHAYAEYHSPEDSYDGYADPDLAYNAHEPEPVDVSVDYSEDFVDDSANLAMDEPVAERYDDSYAMDNTAEEESFVDDSYDDSYAMDDTTTDESYDVPVDDSYDVV